jgi:hypothetical protein
LGIAVTAAQQIHQHIVRQFADLQLSRIGRHFIRQAAVGDHKLVPHFDQTRGRDDPGTGVAEHVDIVARRNVWRELNSVLTQEIAPPGRINAEHQNHRGILEALKGDVIAGTDFHVVSPEDCSNINYGETSPRRRVRSR